MREDRPERRRVRAKSWRGRDLGALSGSARGGILSAPHPPEPREGGKEVPRPREHILSNLEALYREAHTRAQAAADPAEMARLDFEFRRDQLYLEAVLDVRDLLRPPPPPPDTRNDDKSVIEQISELRSLTRLPFGR